MTVLQVAWLNANPTYTPLCQCHPSYVFTSLLSVDINGNTSPGMTINLPEQGPLSGDENTASIVVGILKKVGT